MKCLDDSRIIAKLPMPSRGPFGCRLVTAAMLVGCLTVGLDALNADTRAAVAC